MELIVFTGIPASGKSSFYKANFFNTHMRISLDLFNTRNKENRFMQTAFELQQRVVIDNTDVTRKERANYIQLAKEYKYQVIGYYFESKLQVCMKRNENRVGTDRISEVGIITKYKALQLPEYDEGFDKLYYVVLENDQFNVKEWKNEI
ncbi:MAG TPA: AAA family ATPase [Ohtaekwangia sp.]|uniref:AAA family ATPase n=1 Tax=Ohtaekwangia sp. TaxID=2066019 RepID=UPI002F9269F1